LSNLKLCVVNDMAQHNILDLLDMDLMVMVNSDDPSYFGGYLNENYLALLHNLPLTEKALVKLVKNSFSASFLPKETKREWIAKIDSLL
jgi:adenosine deaminase